MATSRQLRGALVRARKPSRAMMRSKRASATPQPWHASPRAAAIRARAPLRFERIDVVEELATTQGLGPERLHHVETPRPARRWIRRKESL